MSWGTRLFDWVGLGLGSRAEPDRSRTAGDWLTAFCSRSWELFFWLHHVARGILFPPTRE